MKRAAEVVEVSYLGVQDETSGLLLASLFCPGSAGNPTAYAAVISSLSHGGECCLQVDRDINGLTTDAPLVLLINVAAKTTDREIVLGGHVVQHRTRISGLDYALLRLVEPLVSNLGTRRSQIVLLPAPTAITDEGEDADGVGQMLSSH